MKEKISIVIPAYNIENYIGKTLDSILCQSYKNIEIIVVNDGSVDGTADVIDRYASDFSNIKVIHKENGGVTSARIRGIEESSGEWIGFVDGDDYVDSDMFERLIKNGLEYNADISHCGYKMIFPDGRVDYYYNSGRIVVQNKKEALNDLLSGNVYEPALWNKLFRKSLFDNLLRNNLMDNSVKINEDLLMNYWLFKEASSSVFQDICMYHYVIRKNSAATSKLNEHKLLDPIKVMRIIYDDVSEDEKNVVFSRITRQLVNLSTMETQCHREIVAPIRKKARKELRKSLKSVMLAPISTKTKLMALWASAFPNNMCLVHFIYGKIKGNADKYKID